MLTRSVPISGGDGTEIGWTEMGSYGSPGTGGGSCRMSGIFSEKFGGDYQICGLKVQFM